MIGRELGYHGSTLAGASVGGLPSMQEPAGLPLPGFVHIPAPYWYRSGGELDPHDFGIYAARYLEQKILEVGCENVAAFVAEPIQGGGGAIFPPESYWPEIQRICTKYGVLLVIDEVITAFGRTGHWFACEHYGIKPDILNCAKAITSGYIPLSATLLSSEIAETLGDVYFTHGYTYSGHPVACAVGLANLQAIEDDGLLQRVREETAPHLAKRLLDVAAHPLVGETSAVGLLAAFELTSDKETHAPFDPALQVGPKRLRDRLFHNGVILRPLADRIAICPPLIVTCAEIDIMVDTALQCLDEVEAELRSQGRNDRGL
jgi:putrescine aminotransferase